MPKKTSTRKKATTKKTTRKRTRAKDNADSGGRTADPAEIPALLRQLKSSDDPAEKRRLRAQLRSRGHFGGLGEGGGRPAGSGTTHKATTRKKATSKKTTRKRTRAKA